MVKPGLLTLAKSLCKSSLCFASGPQVRSQEKKSDLGETEGLSWEHQLQRTKCFNSQVVVTAGMDHIRFVFLLGGIQPVYRECRNPPFCPRPSPCGLALQRPPAPHCSHCSPGYLPKSQPSCPTAAGVVSSLLFSPPGIQNDHVIPSWRLGFCKEAGGEGGGRTFSPDAAGCTEDSREELAEISGLEEARSSRKEKVKPWHSPPSPKGHPEGWGWWRHKPPGRKEVTTMSYLCLIPG